MFKLKSKYTPSPDQKKAIDEIVSNIHKNYDFQTLWGVTGSGKTFTMANVIEKLQKPTLIIAHNKTLAAQLAQEFREFFPKNAVHYFVSYYDYYQPEAYVSKTDTYIEKEATINEEIDRLRHAATQDLLTRKDVIIVASVSCIYGIGDKESYAEQVFSLEVGKSYVIEDLLKKLIGLQYFRANSDFKSGSFKIKGDTLEILPASSEKMLSIEFFGDELDSIKIKNYLTGEIYETIKKVDIFPAKHTVATKEKIKNILPEIQKELDERLKIFEKSGDVLKYERLKTKVEYDLEMMMEVGYVNGIENYSRYLDARKPGEAPNTLFEFFPKDSLFFVDESHMSFSQIGGMYAGDRSRKENLVENGFRLPSALDNRPLKFEEFEKKAKNIIAVSATPSKYEVERSMGQFLVNSNQFSDKNVIPAKAGINKNVKIQINDSVLSLEGQQGGGSKEKYFNDSISSMEGQQSKVEGAEEGSFSIFKNYDPVKDGVWKSSEEVRIIPQIMRPTGLLDPEIEIREMEFMVDDIMKNISEIVEKNERMLITTITKRSSEELSEYLLDNGVKVKYLHSEIETLERLEILKELREGKIDVIVGVNLLREGLDLPEVSKIAILDADKQGFLRSESALIQIIGRAARNENGKVYMYSEKLKNPDFEKMKKEYDGLYRLDAGKLVNSSGFIVSEAMRKAINMTYYRRGLQEKYNKEHNIIPKTVFSEIKDMGLSKKEKVKKYIKKSDLIKEIKRLELEMDLAATNLDFEKAAELRDEIFELKKKT